MAKNLLIVESPAKAKTINKYLGKDFTVLASYGHVRDLVPKEGAVDPDNDFAMRYELIEKNEKHVEAHRQGRQGRRPHLPGDRPGPRGRGDQLAHRRDPAGARPAQGQGAAAGGVHRDHPARDQRGGGPAARDRRRPGRCAAGAARARLPGRLQPVAGAVAQGAARPVRRPRAVAGAAHDRRARGGDRSLRRARVLVDRGRVRASAAGLHRRLVKLDGQKFEQFTITDGDSRRGRARAHRRAPPTARCTSPTSPARSASAGRRRRSSPRRCSRKPRASSASPPGAPCASRRSSTKASRSARKARSA